MFCVTTYALNRMNQLNFVLFSSDEIYTVKKVEWTPKGEEIPFGSTLFEADSDISMCVNMLVEFSSKKHANGVGRGFGKAIVYFTIQILRHDHKLPTRGLIARTESMIILFLSSQTCF